MTEKNNYQRNKFIPLSLVFLMSLVALLVVFYKLEGFLVLDFPSVAGSKLAEAVGAVLGIPVIVVLIMALAKGDRKKGRKREIYVLLLGLMVVVNLFVNV